MKSRWTILLVLLALSLLLISWVCGWFEPRYQGQRASTFVFGALDTSRLTFHDATNKFRPMGAKLALPPLIKALKFEDSVLRKKYAAAHAKAPKALQKVLPRPRPVQHLRPNAITALSLFGPEAAPAVPALIQIHGRCDPIQRMVLSHALASIGPGARAAVPLLLQDLTNAATTRFAYSFLQALGAIDTTGELSAREIIPFTDVGDFNTLGAALDALGRMSRATPALTTNLWRHARGSGYARLVALRNLNTLGLLTRDILDPFFRELTNGTPAQRLTAMGVVTYSTNFAAELVPILCRLARDDPDSGVRRGTLSPLLAYAAQTNVAPALREEALFLVLTRGTNQPSWAAMGAIRGLASGGASLVPLLLPVLTNAEPRMRGKATEAIAQLGHAASNAIPQLRPLVHDEWLFVREAATNALRAGGGL